MCILHQLQFQHVINHNGIVGLDVLEENVCLNSKAWGRCWLIMVSHPM